MSPETIGNLPLCNLNVRDNQLNTLPNSLGRAVQLDPNLLCRDPHSEGNLYLYGNPLETIPQYVLTRGAPTILEYLRDQGQREK